MPPLPPSVKPTFSLTKLRNLRPLSNEKELLGKRVVIVTDSVIKAYRGQIGVVTAVVTAQPAISKLHEDDCRGVFYTIEIPQAVLTGLTWFDFIQVVERGERQNGNESEKGNKGTPATSLSKPSRETSGGSGLEKRQSQLR